MKEVVEVSIIEDDKDMRETVGRYLEKAGITVYLYEDTNQIDEILHKTAPQIIVLDINLPGENGLIAAARLRSRSMLGIIMVTARAAHDDRLLGLSMGVDHYLTKPVDLRELESIIRNLARRLAPEITGAEASGQPVLEDDLSEITWTLDTTTWQLCAPNGATIDLSSAEYQLLLPLLAKPGQPATRDFINARLGKPRLSAENRSLDVLVSRIKRKIESGTGTSVPLRSARGSGYVFTGAATIMGGTGNEV